MKTKALKLIFIVLICMPPCSAFAVEGVPARAFAGRDVHIAGDTLTTLRGDAGIEVLVVEKKFEITAGADTFKADKAVVWLKREEAVNEKVTPQRQVWCYISGRVSAARGKGTRIEGLNWQTIENGRAMVIWFEATGDVFITAQNVQSGPISQEDFYAEAFRAVSSLDKNFAGNCQSVAPAKLEQAKPPSQISTAPPAVPLPGPKHRETGPDLPGQKREGAFGFIEKILGTSPQQEMDISPATAPEQTVMMRYAINLAPAGDTEPNIELTQVNGKNIATVIGRFYLWQKQDERGGLLEMQADAAVVYYSTRNQNPDESASALGNLTGTGSIEAIYVKGDVVLTEGIRTIRADEMFYDFVNKQGLAVNAVLRSFDVGRGVPIYIRADKIRQLAQGKFAAENVVLTTSEFATPQISLQASRILVTDTTTVDEETGKSKDSSYDVQIHKLRLKAKDITVFQWPFMRSNLERPDVPFKAVRLGNDNTFGTSVETKWYLSRLLGLREPPGTDGSFELDYYSKRGLGAGIDVDYKQESRFGRIFGYIIDDHGEDRLGRIQSRRDLEPPEELRGWFSWAHREFMPYNWQLTTGIDYESDERFVESYYRRYFNNGPDRETYVHLKRIEDNWGLSLLGKGRINNFEDVLAEYPTGEFHLTGQSIFDDKMTLYSDTQGGQFRQFIGDYHNTAISEEPFAFGSHRTEIDMPIWLSGFKVVPFASGTVGYDDRSGFNRSFVDGSNSGTSNEETVEIGELGIRATSEYWKVYKGVESRLLDIDGLRHTVRPELAAAVFEESDHVVKQHDVVHLGISQRLQTKRGPAENQRTVDWMRLDLGGTWFTDNEPRTAGSAPYRFIWNRPMTPLRATAIPTILNGDLQPELRRFEFFGPQRDYFNADYMWQISETTALLSDAFYDVHEGTIEQFNFGFTRTRLPDLSYYFGTRYLRNIQVLDEHGSNTFVSAASYVLDERYTVVFSQQYDFDHGANVDSEITLIRRYNRMFWSLSFGADASLDRQSIIFSIWPQGVPELSIGSSRYVGLTGPGGY